MNKTFIIYCHKNKINGKVYIGITSSPNRRWIGNGTAYKGCNHFYPAIKKYGWNNFEHIILYENLTKEEACKKEIDFIKQYGSTDKDIGYNVSNGGVAFRFGVRYTDDEKKEMSVKRKGRNKGKRFSINSEFKNGHTFAETTLKKMSDAKIGKPPWNKGLQGYNSGDENPMKREDVRNKFIGANNSMSRKIQQFTKNNEFIKEWSCMSDAAKEHNLHISNITHCCKGNLKTTGGYIFKYAS